MIPCINRVLPTAQVIIPKVIKTSNVLMSNSKRLYSQKNNTNKKSYQQKPNFKQESQSKDNNNNNIEFARNLGFIVGVVGTSLLGHLAHKGIDYGLEKLENIDKTQNSKKES